MSVRKLGLPSAEFEPAGSIPGVSAEQVERKRQAERQLRFLARDVLPLVSAVVSAFSHLELCGEVSDDHPLAICIPLGEYRRALRLKPQLEDSL